eukprot:TRINITY_DN587_c0_g2_i1.p1 TRINITY_DN587_c0_g2~~TRINITY_DN587_c0_g2_i1.p1  ORF type:complete len:170 (-),score=18.23 TRINITY_DN587_c0_g2_i1:1366-1875(-)
MFYGTLVWDPWLIVAQIACLQCLFYLSLGTLLWLFVGTHVDDFTLKFFFDFNAITARTFTGWCTMLAYVLNATVGAVFLLVIVERTKKCLDFSSTVHIVHLFFCLIYGGVPASLIWWVLHGVCLVLMTVVGEWLCMRREQRDIPLGSGGGGGNGNGKAQRNAARSTLPL